MFAIIDIETCGSKFHHPQGRIIDIAILIHDGLQVVDSFSTLINPGCHISGFYSNLSGITNDMVADAPHFHQVAKKIVELTEGKIFVAHNVGFDYSFIKEEFAFLGYNFRREKLCTVRLSRKLLPKRISYSLGHLCASLNIPINGRHRAFGDAEATAKLFDLLLQLKSQNPQYRSMGVDELMTSRIDKIKDYILKKLPEACGVYYFLDKEGKIIYIGKSTNIYNRAISHFNNHERKGKKMLNELYNAEHVLTGSELIALLLEAEEIKKHKPHFNRAQKADIFTHSINWFEDKDGIINFKIAPYEESENSLQAFTTHIAARERLETWIDENSLCLKYCGLSEDEVCFNHQIKKCHGICAGLETREEYNTRALKLVDEYSFGKKNFMVVDKGRRPDEQSLILIEDGHYAGYGYFDSSTQMQNPAELKEVIKHTTYYADHDNLVRGYLKSKNLRKISL
ncbi:MAG TPA: exonuclease domain-containing protein [Bacteroidia bacterium]|nr:exonuclease domain-containing protein [Bacteroidia bacterium]